MIAYQGCMSGRAFRAGPGFRAYGLCLSKCSRPISGLRIKLFTTFRVTMFFLRNVSRIRKINLQNKLKIANIQPRELLNFTKEI